MLEVKLLNFIVYTYTVLLPAILPPQWANTWHAITC